MQNMPKNSNRENGLKTNSIPRMTVKERILVHLSRYMNIAYNSVNVPYELTQDGIGNIVGVSRAHISLELRDLISRGDVSNWKAHIQGCDTRRYAYILSKKGKETAQGVIDTFVKFGYDPTIALDMRKCDPMGTWNAMSDADRDVLGIACLFRVPVPRNILPRTDIAAIPISPDGKIAIPGPTARSYLSLAEPERIRFWHAWIAEYWTEECMWSYALYHFIMGRCFKEARDCITLHAVNIVNVSEKDTLKALKKVPPEETTPEMTSALAEVAMNLRDYKTARKCIEALEASGYYTAPELNADYLMRVGDPVEAAKAAEAAFFKNSSMHAAALAAEAFANVGNLESASEYAKKAAELMTTCGETYDLDRIFAARSMVAYKNKDVNRCLLMCRRAVENAPPVRLELRKSQEAKMQALIKDRR